ncbi:Holliday junction recognition protein isoform X3 [Antechinus flavipes]|uniref:Holliday junction recognition protein isoform X3 n=1 Tax=Antechinus flavipes TaxID=38775 RepID=UPI002235EDBC|nr:Holliday junction recognition protein isoform X3 [Antechinus flavipes]
MAATGVRPRQRRRRRQQQLQLRCQLLNQLQANNRRFAHTMGTLVAKYDRPFKEDKLVHIATLTYQSEMGLKIWGGKRVSNEIFRNTQISLEKEGYSMDNFTESTSTDDTSSGADITLVQRNDTSLWNEGFSLESLSENDLDKKNMTRVDVILEDDHPRLIMFDSFNKRKDPMILSAKESSEASLDSSSIGPRKDNRLSVTLTSPLRCPRGAGGAAACPNESLLAWRARRSRLSGCMGDVTWGDEERELTLSDVYAEMLCSLSKCLPSQKVGLVSTNKYISKGWFSKKRRLNVTLTMESSFLKISRKFRIVPEETSGLIDRNPRRNFLPPVEPDKAVVKAADLTCSQSAASPLGLRGTLQKLSIRESPSRTMEVSQAGPPPCQSPPRTPTLSLPQVLTSAKEWLCPTLLGAPARDGMWQKQGLSRSLGPPKPLQTPTKAPWSRERLCQERSASDGPGPCLKTGFPREKATKARKALPFGLEQTPYKGPDPIDSMFDTYSQETAHWAQELLFLKKSRQKPKEPNQSKLGDSLPGFSPSTGSQEPQKAASPQSSTRNSLCRTITPLCNVASPQSSTRNSPCGTATPLHCKASLQSSTRNSPCGTITPLRNVASPQSSTRNSPCGTVTPLRNVASPQSSTRNSPCGTITPLRNVASPRSSTRNSPCGTVTPLHSTASLRPTSKGDFVSPPKRRKLSSSQTSDCFSSSKTEDKVAPDGQGLSTDPGESPAGRLMRSSRVSGAQPLCQGVACGNSAKEQRPQEASPEGRKRRGLVFGSP